MVGPSSGAALLAALKVGDFFSKAFLRSTDGFYLTSRSIGWCGAVGGGAGSPTCPEFVRGSVASVRASQVFHPYEVDG